MRYVLSYGKIMSSLISVLVDEWFQTCTYSGERLCKHTCRRWPLSGGAGQCSCNARDAEAAQAVSSKSCLDYGELIHRQAAINTICIGGWIFVYCRNLPCQFKDGDWFYCFNPICFWWSIMIRDSGCADFVGTNFACLWRVRFYALEGLFDVDNIFLGLTGPGLVDLFLCHTTAAGLSYYFCTPHYIYSTLSHTV